jgi:hypothetical protein
MPFNKTGQILSRIHRRGASDARISFRASEQASKDAAAEALRLAGADALQRAKIVLAELNVNTLTYNHTYIHTYTQTDLHLKKTHRWT